MVKHITTILESFKLKSLIKIIISVILVIMLFMILQPMLPYHHLHMDERYYIGRALQNLEFLQGLRSPNKVWFSRGNHPFSAEFIIGLSLLLQGEATKAPENPWKANITGNQLIASRRSALIVGLTGLASVAYLSLTVNFLATPAIVLYLLSSPGFIDFSLRCMLDIYVASFTTLSLVSTYWYVTKKLRNAFYIAAICLGIAIGSKTSWDPLIAGTVILVAVILVEKEIKEKLLTMLKLIALSALSFTITSTVTVIRLEDHVKSVLGPHGGRIRITNIIERQPLISTKEYTIFVFQQPSNMLLFCTALLMVILIILYKLFIVKDNTKNISFKCKDIIHSDTQLFYLLLIASYVTIDLLLTASTFEYGRNYARHTLYQSLLIVSTLNYIYYLSKRAGATIALIFFIISLFTIDYYLNVFNKLYFSTGWALLPRHLIPQWSIYIGYTIVIASIVLIAFSFTTFLTVTSSNVVFFFNTTVKRLKEFKIPAGKEKAQAIVTEEGIESKKYEIAEKVAKEKSKKEEELNQILRNALDTVKAENFIKELVNYLNTYAYYRKLKGATSREILIKIAKEHVLNEDIVLDFIKEYEAFVYGKKKLNENIIVSFKKELRKLLTKNKKAII